MTRQKVTYDENFIIRTYTETHNGVDIIYCEFDENGFQTYSKDDEGYEVYVYRYEEYFNMIYVDPFGGKLEKCYSYDGVKLGEVDEYYRYFNDKTRNDIL